jgi:axial budding pattern protein 2
MVAAAPQVNYPFNAQYPPVARVGEPFSFQFAPNTFEPQSENLQYSLIGSPSWLSLNAATRTLWGTPGYTGSKSFTITATGAAGAVATMQATLMVTNSGSPSPGVNVSEVLSKAGKLSGPTSLALPASKPLDVKFPPSTFTSTGKPIFYYATLSDHTPLPSWIAFDADSLHFSGTTPQLSTSPQTFEILLIATDVPNYAGTSIIFSLTLRNHELLFSPLRQTVEVSKGNAVTFSTLRNHLTLDGNQVSDGDLQSVTAETPSWLSFDSQTFAFTGSPPAGLMSQEVTVVAKDTSGDVANTTIHFSFLSSLFNGEIGQVNITVGMEFKFILSRSLLKRADEVTFVEFGNAAKWLSFDPSTLTISGQVPADTPLQDIQATLIANSKDGTIHDSQTFKIHFSALESMNLASRTPIPSDNSLNSTAAPGTEKKPSDHDHSISKRNAIIVGSVVGGVVLFIAIVMLAVLLCRHRRQTSPHNSPRPDISRPIMSPNNEWEDIEEEGTPQHDFEKGEVREIRERTLEHPPQVALNLPLASPKHTKNVLVGASFVGDEEARILGDFYRSSWDYKEEIGSSHNPHDSMKIPTEMARISRSISEASDSPTKRRRRTTPSYRDSYLSNGVPVIRRVTVLGHSRNSYSVSRMNGWSAVRRPSAHTSVTSYSTQDTSMLSSTLSAFPQPPSSRHTTGYLTSTDKRRSIRMVPTIRDRDSLPDSITMDEKRHSYIRKRASHVSPFFASSRASSSSYKPPVLPSEPGPSSLVEQVASEIADIVKPSASIYSSEMKNFPGSLRTQSGSTSQAFDSARQDFLGSLCKKSTHRYFATTNSATSIDPTGRIQKRPNIRRRNFPDGFPRPVSLSNTRHSLRGQSLGSIRSSKIFVDVEMSEREYSFDSDGEDDDNEGGKEAQFVLPPLNITTRNLKRDSRTARHVSKAMALETEYEHGGKENKYYGPTSAIRNTHPNLLSRQGQSARDNHFNHLHLPGSCL